MLAAVLFVASLCDAATFLKRDEAQVLLPVPNALAGGDSDPRPSSTIQTVEVAVVGGGISGLYSAWRLQNASINALVFEASSRIGGRTYSKPLNDACPSIVAELGGMRLRTKQDRLALLIAQQLGVKLLPFNMNSGDPSIDSKLSDDPVDTMYMRGTRVTRARLNAMTVGEVRTHLGYDIRSPFCNDTDNVITCTDIIANTLIGISDATRAGVLRPRPVRAAAASLGAVLRDPCAGPSNAETTYLSNVQGIPRHRWSLATLATALGYSRDTNVFLDDSSGYGSKRPLPSHVPYYGHEQVHLASTLTRLASLGLPSTGTTRSRRCAPLRGHLKRIRASSQIASPLSSSAQNSDSCKCRLLSRRRTRRYAPRRASRQGCS